MAARTLAQVDIEIAEVATAITGILTGAQASRAADGRMLTRADLASLIQLKKNLIDERDALDNKTTRVRSGSVLLGEV